MGVGLPVDSAGDVNGDGYDDVIIGSEASFSQNGVALVFHGSPGGIVNPAAWSFRGTPGAQVGSSVSGAGDVNGDGYDDVVVGAVGFSNGESFEGAAMLFLGSPAGLSHGPSWHFESDQDGGSAGASVAGAGDVDRDGYDDVLVGTFGFDAEFLDQGRAWLFRGTPSGPSSAPDWIAEGSQGAEGFAQSVALAGDVNGDGYDDVIIGSPAFSDEGQFNLGKATLYHGSAAGLLSTPSWVIEFDEADSAFGHSVSTGGDVNGDSFADVIIGAPRFADPAPQTGEAFVYHGAPAPCLEGAQSDLDADGVACIEDNCPDTANADQTDADSDTLGDACDNCPSAPNAPQVDYDADGHGSACDCTDTDAAVFPGAVEVNDGADNQCPDEPGHGAVDETSGDSGFHAPGDTTSYSWPAQAGAEGYEVARARSADFTASCMTWTVAEPSFTDVAEPPPGSVFYYLNRPVSPHAGSWGFDSAGVERTVPCSSP